VFASSGDANRKITFYLPVVYCHHLGKPKLRSNAVAERNKSVGEEKLRIVLNENDKINEVFAGIGFSSKKLEFLTNC